MPKMTEEMLTQLFQLRQGPVSWDDLLDRVAATRLADLGFAKRIFTDLQYGLTEEGALLVESILALSQDLGQ